MMKILALSLISQLSDLVTFVFALTLGGVSIEAEQNIIAHNLGLEGTILYKIALFALIIFVCYRLQKQGKVQLLHMCATVVVFMGLLGTLSNITAVVLG